MSGHSKWATTKHQKARMDKKRAGAFTKITRMIMVAARDGADPEMNFKLRLAIEKAKAVNMPKDNIERAIKKGAGLEESERFYEILYEAYGPNGVALLIEATTDNKNRTASNIRAILNKRGGSLGTSNSVLYMFKRKGVIVVKMNENMDFEEFMLEMIDQGAEDLEQGEENTVVIYTTVEKFLDVKKYLEEKGLEIIVAELEYIPDTEIELDEEAKGKVEALIEALENDDDVNKVYTNAKL